MATQKPSYSELKARLSELEEENETLQQRLNVITVTAQGELDDELFDEEDEDDCDEDEG